MNPRLPKEAYALTDFELVHNLATSYIRAFGPLTGKETEFFLKGLWIGLGAGKDVCRDQIERLAEERDTYREVLHALGGDTHAPEAQAVAFKAEEIPCPWCGGSARRADAPCDRCNGHGKMLAFQPPAE